MISHWKQVTQRISLGLPLALWVVLLTACGGLGSTTPTPTPAPTSALAATGQIYKGTGFTISYPQSWTEQSIGGGAIAFTDASNINIVTIALLPNPGGIKSASDVADATFPTIENAALTDPKAANVPATTTVAGATWTQRGATGTLANGGPSTPGELVLLVNNHPANASSTQAFEIYYGGPSATFSSINTTAFRPMLQSFKFTA